MSINADQGRLSPPNTLEQGPPPIHPPLLSLPVPLEVGPPYCGQGVWGSALGPQRVRPPNGIW